MPIVIVDVYNDNSKKITQYIKDNNYLEALDKLNENLKISLQLEDSYKYYSETAHRKIKLLIKFNKYDEVIRFKEELSSKIVKYEQEPFYNWTLSKYFKSIALIDEYVAYRSLIKSFEKLLYSYGLINEEMIRQRRLTELKLDQKNFYEELIEKISRYGYNVKNKSELKTIIQKGYSELKEDKIFILLLDLIIFPINAR